MKENKKPKPTDDQNKNEGVKEEQTPFPDDSSPFLIPPIFVHILFCVAFVLLAKLVYNVVFPAMGSIIHRVYEAIAQIFH